MATNIFMLWTIALVFTVASLMDISCADMADIPGQVRSDDPHACLWFIARDGSSIFRCCNGYFKINDTNLIEKCVECPSGSYGFYCQDSCVCENSGTCNSVDGSCRCPSRYFGNNCQYHCDCRNGATCLYDGRCSCSDGFYGNVCERNCVCLDNNKCDSETGECLCKDGFYGRSCLPCQCSDTEQCDSLTGKCSCRPGHYGDKCDKECSCFNGAYCGNDHFGSCDCPSGWTGSRCTDCDTDIVSANGLSFCYDKCLHCYNGNTCSVQNGDCECSPGWQGNRCNHKCEPGFYGNNCLEVCQCKGGMCDHVTGICQYESKLHSKHSEDACPHHCLECVGDICTSCKPGWTGERCITKCKRGFYGDGCQETCTECNCSLYCHHTTGLCPDVVRCEEHKSKFQNCRTCTENPFKVECHNGWTGRFCTVRTSENVNANNKDFNVSYEYNTSNSSTTREVESPISMDQGFTSPNVILVSAVVVLVLINVAVITTACYHYVKRQERSRKGNDDCGRFVRNVELNDHQRAGNISDYENISRGITINDEKYQYLCDFTHSQYQKLGTSPGGSRTSRSML